MQFSKLNVALAVCNLRNLGYSPDEALAIAQDWARRQLEQSVERIEDNLRRTLPLLMPLTLPEGIAGGRMFVSCHYSLYPIIFGVLAQRSPTRKVVSLIGMQSETRQMQLREMARRFEVELQFIASGFGMLREMRTALAEGHCGMVLVDIPWSNSGSDLDAEHRAQGGRFLARSSLFRLIEAIDPHARFVLAQRTGKTFQLVDHGHAHAHETYRAFAQALREDPAEYERLHQFHRFFAFDQPRPAAVRFQVGADDYLVSAQTMRAWKLSGAPRLQPGEILREGRLLRQYCEVANHDVSEVLVV